MTTGQSLPPADSPGSGIRVSVIIKALNEEANIARAIESALVAVQSVEGGGEVILADSLSTDRTVEIARGYPIRIVQLVDSQDRSCGVGAQLGMVIARGDFVYILDGDMELLPGYLPIGLERFRHDDRLAGVAGLVQEMNVVNQVFLRRQHSSETTAPRQDPVCLQMGGLYRRDAVQALGYLTNRNLHAFEEFELGVRLIDAGWRLERVGTPAVRHYGHTDSTYALLWRRWRTRHSWGHGELLRQAWRRSHSGLVLKHLRMYRVTAFVGLSWIAVVCVAIGLSLSPWWAVGLVLAYWASVHIALFLRKGSFAAASYSIVGWHFNFAGLLGGLLTAPRTDADAPVVHRIIQ